MRTFRRHAAMRKGEESGKEGIVRYFHVQFESETLGGEGEFAVYLPAAQADSYPVLWVLHGAFAQYSESFENSSLCRYAENRGMAIVAPSSYLGVYQDMVYGENGYSFVREVFEKAPKLFTKLSLKPEENFLMGISMGGYGSFKLAMEFPERFLGAAGFSSPVDMVFTMGLLEGGKHGGGHELYDAFGSSEGLRGTVSDVIGMAEKNLAEGRKLPRLALCWGDSEMAGMEDSRASGIFRELGIRIYTRIGHGGHSFDTWDAQIPKVLDYLMSGEEKED